MVTPARTRPGTREEVEVDAVGAVDTPWITIVWDDPVNLMTYVTYVFQKLFGYSEPHATKLMLQVHNEGKAVVSAGSRESMEVDVSKLHAAGLWARLEAVRDSLCANGSASRPPTVPVFGPPWPPTRLPCSGISSAR